MDSKLNMALKRGSGLLLLPLFSCESCISLCGQLGLIHTLWISGDNVKD